MPNSPPRKSPAPPPDKPIPEGTVGDEGQEGRPLSPSLKQIRLPCRSLTGGSTPDKPIPEGTVGDEGQEGRPFSPSLKPIRLPCRSLTGGSKPDKPIPKGMVGDEGQEGRPLSPSLKPIRLPCWSLTGGSTPDKPIPEGTVGDEGQEGRSLSPSLKQIRLPCRSLTGGSPSMSPSGEQQRPTGVSPSASPSEYLPLRLPKSRMRANTSPSQPPPWAPRTSLPRPPLWGRGSAKKRKREATPQLQPSEPQLQLTKIHKPIHKEEEDVSQEELGQEQSGSDSSPIREPQPPLVPIWTNSTGKVYYGLTSDRVALDTYYQAYQRYTEKQARQDQLATLRPTLTVSSIMESYGPKQKEILLDVSKSVLSLSAHLDDKEINRCTGIVVEWNEEKRCGIVLTSAWLICMKKPFDDWSDKEYASKAKVLIHLLDGSTLNSKLLYFSKHYDLAFYEVSGDLHLKILPLEANLEYGQDLCLLARDMKMDLICKAVNVNYVAPCEHQHNHYLFINHSIPKCGSGGALADLNGRVVGMLFCTLPLTAFTPSSLILRCSVLLRKFGRLARPQLGLKLRTVGFLDVSSIESLSRSCGVTSGLIVGEVSAECVAERLGIRAGDVILSCQGESVSSVTQWEEILLGIGGEHLEKSNDLSLKADVEVEVFHVRKGIRRIVHLTVELSDGNEVFRSV